MKNRNKGFTLVELIVVIAIIGILAAVLVPNYIGYVGKARTNVCKSSIEEACHYYIVNTALAENNFAAALEKSLVELGGESVNTSTAANGKQTVSCTGLCPTNGTYSITINTESGAVTNYACSEHSPEGVDIKAMVDDNDYVKLSIGVTNLLGGDLTPAGASSSFANYFKNAGQVIDSNGPNYAPLLKAELEKMKLSTGENTLWKVVSLTNTTTTENGYNKQLKVYYVDTTTAPIGENTYNGKQINVDISDGTTRYYVMDAEINIGSQTVVSSATKKGVTYDYIKNKDMKTFDDTKDWTVLK